VLNLALATLAALLPLEAHAYLDPKSGSMVLQLMIAGLAGSFVIGRDIWRRMTSRARSRLVSRSRKKSSPR
jgi:hypothetical protein